MYKYKLNIRIMMINEKLTVILLDRYQQFLEIWEPKIT